MCAESCEPSAYIFQGLKIDCCPSLRHIVHFLKDADQRRSQCPVYCHFVGTIRQVEIGVDESNAVLSIQNKCYLMRFCSH